MCLLLLLLLRKLIPLHTEELTVKSVHDDTAAGNTLQYLQKIPQDLQMLQAVASAWAVR